MFVVKKSKHNPILVPDRNHYWEEFATFNLCPVRQGENIYGLYRAISASDSLREPRQVSIIGLAKSKDGIHFKDRKPFIFPEEEWEQFGCEDPRVTYFEGKYYIFYTALSKYPLGAEGIKVAVAITRDFKKIEKRYFITPFNAKAMTLFPERINGKIVAILSVHTDSPPAKMALVYLDKIEDLWSSDFWLKWEKDIDEYTIDPRRNDYDHVEVGAPPIKTRYGWLLVYSHIRNYFNSPEHGDRIFGIEALLLDINNPQKIIGRTSSPLLVPEEAYELSGYVSNVVFPSGALLEKETLTIYYGAADTTVCIAKVNLSDLVSSMHPDTKDDFNFKRFPQNPILSPREENPWEAKAVFNPAAIELKNKIHILYRALSDDNTSTIGYAVAEDGVNITERLDQPIYVPREDFEMKKINNGNSGCEDPRLTKVGKNIFMCYTAYDSIGPPMVAVSSIKENDFLARKWKWEKPFLVTPRGFDDKDTCIFPEKFKDGYFIMHRVGNEICGDYLKSLDFKTEMVKKCIRIIGPRMNMWDGTKVGVGAPPLKTKHGWLVLYHGVSKHKGIYRVGAMLLSLKDPTEVIARSTDHIFEPEEDWEKAGIIDNVVFPCGMVVRDKKIYMYYGGGDKVVGVASMSLDIILKALVNSKKY